MGVEDINHNSIETPREDVDEGGDENFNDYEWEKEVHKSSFKKKISQAKRLLSNKASNEYSSVDEQHQPKSISKMLISVSKINDLKAMVNLKTKKYETKY